MACSGPGWNYGSWRETETLPSLPTGHDAHPQMPNWAAPDFSRVPKPPTPHLSPSLGNWRPFPALLYRVSAEGGPVSHSRPRPLQTSSSGASRCPGCLPPVPSPAPPSHVRTGPTPTPAPRHLISCQPFSAKLLERPVFTPQSHSGSLPPSDPGASFSPTLNSPGTLLPSFLGRFHGIPMQTQACPKGLAPASSLPSPCSSCTCSSRPSHHRDSPLCLGCHHRCPGQKPRGHF